MLFALLARGGFMLRFLRVVTSFGLLLAALSGAAIAAMPHSEHVILLVEENHSFGSVIGNGSMPYFNQLAREFGLAANYDANSHYSIPNYMWLTAGAYVTMHDNTTATFDVDNVVRHLLVAGKTWRSYQESLPYTGYVSFNTGSYVERHDPFAYFSDVARSSERTNIVPFGEFARDVQNGTLPNYSFITPNLWHDAHNGTLTEADAWLRSNIEPLLQSKYFQPGGDGILFITFDESRDSDCQPATRCPSLPTNVGGGKVATLIISPMARHGYRSTIFYQHPSILRSMLEALGVSHYPGRASTARDMGEFFQP